MRPPSIVTTAGPAVEPITTAEMKRHLFIEEDDDAALDAAVAGYVSRMRDAAETIMRRRLITQTVRLTYDAFPRAFAPPIAPVQSVVSIVYDDDAGVEQTLAPSAYRAVLDYTPARIEPAYGERWPTTRAQSGAVRLTLTVGYGDDATAVPGGVIQALYLMAGDAERFRSNTLYAGLNELPMGAKSLLLPHVLPV